jgi:PAS domain S-box-containing protein
MTPRNIDQPLLDYLSSEHPGQLYFGGARMALLDIEASFWGLWRQMEALAGRQLADSVLQQAGANGGASFARSFISPTYADDAARHFRECVAAYQAAGFGRFKVVKLEWPIGRILVEASDTIETWMQARHTHLASGPVCSYASGVLVGFVNVLAERTDIVCVERACQASGHPVCQFELLPAAQVTDAEIPFVAFSPDPALGRQVNLLELLFERMPMGIAIFDEEFKLRRCNPTWASFIERYTRTTQEQVVPGKSLFELAPGSEANLHPLFERVLAGETLQMDAFHLQSGGIESYWDVVLSPIMEDGKVVGILDVTNDVTEQVVQQAELFHYRQHLEDLVTARTEQLSAANLRLQNEIIERQNIEHALRSERNLVEAVLDTVGALVVMLDREGRIVRFNAACERITGYAFEAVQNQPFWDLLLLPEEMNKVKEVFDSLMAGDFPNQSENYWRTKGGARLIAWSNTALLDSDGSVEYVIATGIDITERVAAENALRQAHSELEQRVQERTAELQQANQALEAEIAERQRAEKALHKNEANLRSLLENAAHFAIFRLVVDPSAAFGARVVMVSPSLRKIAGINDVNNFSAWFDGLHPDDREATQLANSHALQEGLPYNQVVRYFHSEKGAWVWIQTISTPIYDLEGNLTHYGGIIIDVTDQKLAEEALQESQRRMSTLMSNLPGMAYRSLSESGWPLEFVSEGSQSLLGRSPNELLGHSKDSLAGMIDPADRQMVIDQVEEAIRGKHPYTLTYRINTDRDEIKWVWEQGRAVYGDDGNPLALEGFVTDITDRIMAQQLLEQRVSERTLEFSSLLEVSQSLASTLELKPLLGLILDHLKTVVEYHGASIFELEDDVLVLHAYNGPIPQDKALQISFPLLQARLNATVIQTRTPLIISDVRGDDPDAAAFRATAGEELNTTFGYVRSWMGAPLIVKDRAIGMVTLDHSQPDYYTPAHSHLVMAFANQVAVAIENARLYADVRQRADEAQTILAVQKAITGQLDVNDVLQMIADEARRLTSTEKGAVYLLDGDELVISVVSGDVQQQMVGFRLPVKGSIAGLSIETGRSYLISDSQKDARVYGDLVRQVDARTFVIVPLMSSTGPIGTITVANRESRPLGSEDERILKMLSSGAVVALENARLYRDEQEQRRQAERRRQVAEGLRDVLAVLNSNEPLDDILTYILRQSSQFLGSEAGVIYRLDSDRELLFSEASTGMPAEFDAFTTLPLVMSEPNRSILNRQPFAVSDLRARLEDYEKKGIYYPDMEGWIQVMKNHFGAYISAPLVVREEVYGAISLYYKVKRQFSEEDINLAVFLADQVALAIENARLRTQVEQSAVATERSRLARDLHDAVTQTLFSASLIAEVLPRIWDRNQQEGLKRLEELRELTRGALAEMRTLLLELRPSALVEAELAELFRHLTDAFTGRARLPIDFSIEGEMDLPPDVKVSLYRIAQEALNNVAKHAQASQAALHIKCLPDQIELDISDDGIGFDVSTSSPENLGLGIMVERAENIGAKLAITSEIGRGTQISVVWRTEASTSCP